MEKAKRINLALLYGGRSSERTVSIAGANEVERALDPKKYTLRRYDTATELKKLVQEADEIDCAFILLHGKYGEDGTLQGLLDLLGIPYQGSGVLGSALAMDKHMAKIIYRYASILTPKWVTISHRDRLDPEAIISSLGVPVMIKPRTQGSSVGMIRAHTPQEVERGVQNALKWDEHVLVEACVRGRELTVGVIGLDSLEPLPVVEIIPEKGHDFFDFEAKYRPGETVEVCPADIPTEIARKAQAIAVRAHEALQLKGYSRTDMILEDTGKIFTIETNTIPGMTPTSLFPQAAAEAGVSFGALLDRLIEMAMAEGHNQSRSQAA